VAGARAIAQLADGVLHVAVFRVRIAPVTIRVTSGAIWSVSRTAPSSGVGVGGMAIEACECHAMIAWIPAAGDVRERVGCKCGRGVAVIAVEVIDRESHVTLRHARRSCPVMARATVVGDACMAERRWPPRERRMTRTAFLRRGHMRRGFSCGGYAIVAAAAYTTHMGVIDAHNRNPRGSRMAGIATIVAGNVSRPFADCSRAIVAALAAADHLCVVYAGRWPECRRAVTKLARIAARDVRRILAGCGCAVMAAETTGGDAGVRKACGWPPRNCRVARYTIQCSCNVCERLARGVGTVVARAAIAGESRVVGSSRNPRVGAVAGAALGGCRNV